MSSEENWSDEDTVFLMRQRRGCRPFSQIAKLLNRTENSCRSRHKKIEYEEKRRQAEAEAEANRPKQVLTFLPSPASTTALLCGDPLPGRSALDRKREKQNV